MHVSDIYRLLVLLKFGGIYCDDDMILLKKHNLTHLDVPVIGEETRQYGQTGKKRILKRN